MKYALVTGSTKGIGYAISAKLIENGFFVYMNYANDDTAASSIRLDSDKYSIIKADLSSFSGIEALSGALFKQDNLSLDCIVLNAGTTCRNPFGKIGYDDWTNVINANITIPFFIVQELSQSIVDNGNIIFIGSDMGIYPHSVSVPYSVSKAATHMMALSLVKEFASHKIRVNAISPGFIDTQWQKEKPLWLKEKIADKIALRRFGTPEEVACLCMSVIENSYINGSVLSIDGGYNME